MTRCNVLKQKAAKKQNIFTDLILPVLSINRPDMSTITLKQTNYLENELQECRGFAGKLWVRSGHTKMKTVLYCTFILLVVHMILFVKYMQLTRDIYCIIDENAFNLSIGSVLLR